MSSAAHWRSVLAEVEAARLCTHPVRLRGVRLDRSTGELAEGLVLVACKDRRAAVCPSCSKLYRDDAWHLVAAGIRGGKGVDEAVTEHPQLFVTLTAPSFGPVHSRSVANGKVGLCRPRRHARCPHGKDLSCRVRHGERAPELGDPLCSECFDYRGAVLWNAHVPRLWERTCSELYRQTARAAACSVSELRASARLSYFKVVEFQRRGLVHLHVVLRADGAAGPSEPPPPWLGRAVLAQALEQAAASANVAVPEVADTELGRARWGVQVDVRALEAADGEDAATIAAYVAKYATKTADGTGGLAHPIRSRAELERLRLRPHLHRLVRTAWGLGGRRELAPLRLRAHAHALGYGGQFSSKSLRYSTTFKALRAARANHVRGAEAEPFDYDGEWRFSGRGYDDPDAEHLAASLVDALSRAPRQVPTAVPDPSPEP